MTSYCQTYSQRDLRVLRKITSLGDFTRFVMLCATRAVQLINREDMARAIGVDTKTIQAWLGVLESSYIIYLLQPWYNNMNKRIVKAPKLYFYDTGLLCHFLGVNSPAALDLPQSSAARGVGKGVVRPVSARWSLYPSKKNKTKRKDH